MSRRRLTRTPSLDVLASLAAKYRVMTELRRAHRRGEAAPTKATLRELAERHPGALNELETLTLRELERRRAGLEAAVAGGVVEPWMEWLCGYHALMRAALTVKRALATGGRRAALTDVRARAIAGAVSAAEPVDIDAEFVRRVAHPPRGRLVVAVFDELSRGLGVPADTLWTALFPGRRAARPAGVKRLVDEGE